MYNIIGKRYYYFGLSLLIIIPGIIAMIYLTMTTGAPVRLGIDFTGGTSWDHLAALGAHLGAHGPGRATESILCQSSAILSHRAVRRIM